MRRKLDEVAPRTVRVHIPTYKAILEFFRMSPSGMRGSDAIRQVLMHFGQYCQQQMDAGRVASAKDMLEAEQIVLRIMGDQDDRTDGKRSRTHGPNTSHSHSDAE